MNLCAYRMKRQAWIQPTATLQPTVVAPTQQPVPTRTLGKPTDHTDGQVCIHFIIRAIMLKYN
jgi:hypothetical protein